MDSISKVGSAVSLYVVDLGGEVNPGKNIWQVFHFKHNVPLFMKA